MASGWDTVVTFRGLNSAGKVVARWSLGRGWTSQAGVEQLSSGPCFARADLDLGPLWAEAQKTTGILPAAHQIRDDPEVRFEGPIVATETAWHVYSEGDPGEIIVRNGQPVGMKHNAKPIIPWEQAPTHVRDLWDKHGRKMIERSL